MKAILVDDEPKSREVLRTLLHRFCPEVTVIAEASNVAGARELIGKEAPDLVFLDVEMPGGNGFALLDEIGKRSFDIVFVTSYGHYAIPALRYSATDYLLKPVDVEDLKKAVERVANRLRAGQTNDQGYDALKNNLSQPARMQRLAIHGVNEVRFATLSEIVRLEGDNNYTHIITSGGEKLLSSRTLKDYEELLSHTANFIRVHKTHLVNSDHIVSFIKTDGGYIVMSDGSHVEVSRRKKQELMEKMGMV